MKGGIELGVPYLPVDNQRFNDLVDIISVVIARLKPTPFNYSILIKRYAHSEEGMKSLHAQLSKDLVD